LLVDPRSEITQSVTTVEVTPGLPADLWGAEDWLCFSGLFELSRSF